MNHEGRRRTHQRRSRETARVLHAKIARAGNRQRSTLQRCSTSLAWRNTTLRSGQGLDIRATDEDGHLHLRVIGYRTVPLPFESDRKGTIALQSKFG